MFTPCRSKLGLVLIAIAIVTGLAVLAIWDPASNGFYPRCLFFEATGLHCPGCGSQRALHQMARGNVMNAFYLNPLVTTAVAAFAGGLLTIIGCRLRRSQLPRIHVHSRWIWLLAATVVAFWVLRNIPIEPFAYFAPNWL